MEKLYNDNNEVAVAISVGFGAGWSTWDERINPMDKRFNELILNKKKSEVMDLAKSEGLFADGLEDCIIEWIPKGMKFTIEEYDGYESIRTEENLQFIA